MLSRCLRRPRNPRALRGRRRYTQSESPCGWLGRRRHTPERASLSFMRWAKAAWSPLKNSVLPSQLTTAKFARPRLTPATFVPTHGVTWTEMDRARYQRPRFSYSLAAPCLTVAPSLASSCARRSTLGWVHLIMGLGGYSATTSHSRSAAVCSIVCFSLSATCSTRIRRRYFGIQTMRYMSRYPECTPDLVFLVFLFHQIRHQKAASKRARERRAGRRLERFIPGMNPEAFACESLQLLHGESPLLD